MTASTLTTTNAASVAGRLGSDAATARKMKKTSTIVIMPVARNDIGSLLLKLIRTCGA